MAAEEVRRRPGKFLSDLQLLIDRQAATSAIEPTDRPSAAPIAFTSVCRAVADSFVIVPPFRRGEGGWEVGRSMQFSPRISP